MNSFAGHRCSFQQIALAPFVVCDIERQLNDVYFANRYCFGQLIVGVKRNPDPFDFSLLAQVCKLTDGFRIVPDIREAMIGITVKAFYF